MANIRDFKTKLWVMDYKSADLALVAKQGLEPGRLLEHDPKSCARQCARPAHVERCQRVFSASIRKLLNTNHHA